MHLTKLQNVLFISLTVGIVMFCQFMNIIFCWIKEVKLERNITKLACRKLYRQ